MWWSNWTILGINSKLQHSSTVLLPSKGGLTWAGSCIKPITMSNFCYYPWTTAQFCVGHIKGITGRLTSSSLRTEVWTLNTQSFFLEVTVVWTDFYEIWWVSNFWSYLDLYFFFINTNLGLAVIRKNLINSAITILIKKLIYHNFSNNAGY